MTASRFSWYATMSVALVLLSSCLAPLVPKQQIGRTAAAYDAVFRACIDAVADANFAVTSADSKTGLIVGERSLVGGGQSTRLNITVMDYGIAREVRVSILYAPGSLIVGSAADAVTQSLKRRLPDLHVMSGQ